MLATSPADVTGLGQLLADRRAGDDSMAIVEITLSDLAEIESRHGRRSRDEMVVQVVARIRRLTRADDVMIRASTNELVLVASVADVRGGEYLRDRISDALGAEYLVGPERISARAAITVTSSDEFSTLDSLMPGFGSPRETAVVDGVDTHTFETDVGRAHVPLLVYSLPDGYVRAANESARSLYGLEPGGPVRLHLRDIADPIDLRHSIDAMSALSSGAADSYRAQRTLVTDDGPLVMLASVRRLVVGRDALAVVLMVPLQPDEAITPGGEDPLSAALIAGSIDANGSVIDVSDPVSPMEIELTEALGATLSQAAHPADADLIDTMLTSMRRQGWASGDARFPHSVHGWVVCECQMFAMQQLAGSNPRADSPVVDHATYGFVMSTSVSTRSMVDRIARLERHIRRIGSEVHAADLDLAVAASADRDVATVLDVLAPTARQRDIVERLARGQRVSSIANDLFISRSTVRNHLAQVYRLAGVHSQDELLNALRRQ